MGKKKYVVLFILLSIMSTAVATALSFRYPNAQMVGLIISVAFLVAAILAGNWRRSE